MNGKKFILLGCVAACVFAASAATAQMRGHGGSMGRMGMRGAPMPHSMGRMPMQRRPMMHSPSGVRRSRDPNFTPSYPSGRSNRFNHGRSTRFNRFDRFHRFPHSNRFPHFNDVVFIG